MMHTSFKTLCSAFAAFSSMAFFACAAEPSAAAPSATSTNAAVGPKIQFDSAIYDFGKLKAGAPIKHTFIFTNIGDQTLEIKNVRPGCGCTTAGDWTKKAEPGETGTIPIQVNTANFNGGITKTVTVDSNDPHNGNVMLQIKGTLWKPIEVTPALAYFSLSEDAPQTTSIVRIVSNMDQPLKLSEPEISNKSMTAMLKEIRPDKEYQVVIGVVPPLKPGALQATVNIKTSSSEVSNITFTAYANVQPSLGINPTQITLPAGPLLNEISPKITFQNNGTNVLKLIEPSVNLDTVRVSLGESQPNRVLEATLIFPVGFELKEGQKAEFTCKTTNPKFPIVRVPIIQSKTAASFSRPNPHRLVTRAFTNNSAYAKALLPPPPAAKPAAQ
jgi:hypothetical protein